MIRALALVSFAALLAVPGVAADPVPAYSTLGSRRALIDVPVYTTDQKKTVVQQAQVLLKDLYVHREKKVAEHGPTIDPLPLLDALATKAPRLPEIELHQQLEHIFTELRDLHTNYYYPKPYSCYRSVLPFSFAMTNDTSGLSVIAVRSITTNADVLRLSPGANRVRAGDILVSYDGRDPRQAAQALRDVGSGANDAAGLRRGIQQLSFRSQKMHLLPALDTVKLALKSRTGVDYSLELPWVLVADLVCLGQRPATPASRGTAKLDQAVDEYQIEYEKLFKPVKARSKMHSLSTDPTPEPIVSFKVLNNEYGTFGFLRLDSFSPAKMGDDGTTSIIRGLLNKEFKDTDGLIIDLRDNGGGSIRLAEGLIQLFTPNNITPQGFKLLNSPVNHFIYEKGNQSDQVFSSALVRADELGARYTDPKFITSREVANALGQSYFKPVAVLTNSACYSACDMFTAHMQDHGAAVIYGEDASTGGGGANVVAQSAFFQMFPAGQSGVFDKLPGNQDMRVAWRQTVRSGKNAGRLIEDEGVSADKLAALSLSDFYSQDSQQIRTITSDLNRISTAYASSVHLKKEERADVLAGDPVSFFADLTGTTSIEFLVGERSLGIERVDNASQVAMTVPGLHAGQLGNIGSVELLGYFQGARVWRKQVSYRVIPAPLLLQAADAVSLDFSSNAGPLALFTTGGPATDGWVVRDGKLRTGSGGNYKDNMTMEASLFVDLANKPAAKLSFDSEAHTEKDYDFFSVKVFVDGKADELLKPLSGDVAEAHYTYDLTAYAGKKIEIRFTFASDAGVNASGVTIDNLELK